MPKDVLAFHWPRQTAKSPRLRGVDVELARTVEFLTDVEGNWEYFAPRAHAGPFRFQVPHIQVSLCIYCPYRAPSTSLEGIWTL